jgi:chromate transporter
MKIYLQLIISFLKIGLFSFGGGYATMPLIIEQAVKEHHWISLSTFTDLFTISQMTPGPIAINGSTFIGEAIKGFPGAVIATLACIFPSIIICTVLAMIYVRYKHIDWMQKILAYLRPAVVAMIAISGISILLAALFKNSQISINNIQYHSIIAFIVCVVLLRKTKLNPVLIMFLAGIFEVIYQWII